MTAGAPSPWRRPPASHRPSYAPSVSQERYIVPQLAQWIEANLAPARPPGDARARVLDVGCGSQPFRTTLVDLGYAYAGLDVQQSSAVQLDFTASIDGALPSDLLALPAFDLVVCFEVLEHVADWPAAFANLARLVAPGGRLLLTCPHVYQLHDQPFDFWRPTPHVIRHFAERCGFTVQKIDLLGSPWEVVGTTLASAVPLPDAIGSLARARRVVFRIARSGLLALLDRRLLQRLVPLGGPVYLSNAAVLIRQ